jgi:hypothetical protein
MVETPTRSRIEGWTTGHLKSAALGWERQANLTEQLYTQAQHSVDATPWTGAAADSASAKLFENLVKIRGALEHLRQAEKIATAGADAIDAAKRAAVAAITNAVEQFFAVAEDLTVTDRMPPIFGAPLAVVRMLAAAHFQADIRAKAMMLGAGRPFNFESARGRTHPAGTSRATSPTTRRLIKPTSQSSTSEKGSRGHRTPIAQDAHCRDGDGRGCPSSGRAGHASTTSKLPGPQRIHGRARRPSLLTSGAMGQRVRLLSHSRRPQLHDGQRNAVHRPIAWFTAWGVWRLHDRAWPLRTGKSPYTFHLRDSQRGLRPNN